MNRNHHLLPLLTFRLSPSDFAGGQVTASVNGEAIGELFSLGNGTHPLRLTWDAKGRRAWFEVHPNWTEGGAFAAKHSLFLPAVAADFGSAGHLFAGGGVTFSGFQTRKLTASETAKLPTSDVFIEDATAKIWLPVKGITDQSVNTGPSDLLKPLSASFRPLVCWYSGPFLQASRTGVKVPDVPLDGRSLVKVIADAKAPSPHDDDALHRQLGEGLRPSGRCEKVTGNSLEKPAIPPTAMPLRPLSFSSPSSKTIPVRRPILRRNTRKRSSISANSTYHASTEPNCPTRAIIP